MRIFPKTLISIAFHKEARVGRIIFQFFAKFVVSSGKKNRHHPRRNCLLCFNVLFASAYKTEDEATRNDRNIPIPTISRSTYRGFYVFARYNILRSRFNP